ncbi:MAG: hypothetical protein RR673_05790 [Erysipelotrichaceae bacterium]
MLTIKKSLSATLAFVIGFTPITLYAKEKDETVYTRFDEYGTNQDVEVSEHLKIDEKGKIQDKSNLSEIKNTGGKEAFIRNGDSIIWNGKGKDIYYQGKSDLPLPISIKVTYSLNNQEMKAKDMEGKRGSVKIKLAFENHEVHTINNQTIYTPFVLAATTTLSMQENKNIHITNGKVIDNGKTSAVIGLASPGLSKSIDSDSIDLDNITITYETTKFKQNSIYCGITAKLFDLDDLSILNQSDALSEKVTQLTSAANALQEGSDSLSQGLITYNSKNSEFNQGINQLNTGVNDLKNKYQMIDNGIQQLNSGLSSVSNMFPAFNQLAQATNKLSTSSNTLDQASTSVIPSVIKTLDQSIAMLKVQDWEANPDIVANIKGIEVQKQYLTNILQGVNDLNTNLTSLNQKTSQITSKLSTLSPLLSKVNDLANGSSMFNQGLNSLQDATNKLNGASNQLMNASTQLQVGSTTLKNGMNKFNQEGITPITNFINNDLKNKTNQVKLLLKLGNKYNSFALKDDSMQGNTKFIYILDPSK